MSHTVSREPRRNRQFWIDHVQSWQTSGLSKAAYCAQHELKPGSFYNWSRKANSGSNQVAAVQTAGPASVAPVQFHPVNITGSDTVSGSCVHVERGATEVALPANLTAEQIHRWLHAIHQLHV